ncbi:hypothetical protein [Alysiella filiformis]|nr:hypothetical protein [Alysiella filiformis]
MAYRRHTHSLGLWRTAWGAANPEWVWRRYATFASFQAARFVQAA